MRTLRFLLLVGVLLGCSFQVQETLAMPANNLIEKARVFEFLNKYGYFDKISASKGEGEPITSEEVREAIGEMQRFAGLPVTGEMNEETAEMLNKPRCGVRDVDPHSAMKTGAGTRKRRYSVVGDPYKWPDGKTDLTFKIMNYAGESSSITREEVDEDVRAAFKVWSDVTPLTFTEIHSNDADIKIKFGARLHTSVMGDPTFDGPGGTLAHAFAPNSGWGDTDGDVHLDDDETFTHGVYSGTNFFYTVTHEIGHALGMFHSDVSDSLMWPYSRGYDPNFSLPMDDVLGIQELYGPNTDSKISTVTTLPPADPLYCQTTFDTIAFINNEYFMFGSDMMWRFDANLTLLSPPEGQPPKDIFPRFPPKGVKAVYQVGRSGEVIVLKGKNYWVYEASAFSTQTYPLYQLKDIDPEKKKDFPQHVRNLNFPKAVTGVVHIDGIGFSYLISGKAVFTFDEVRGQRSETSVRVNTIFEGVTDRPTAAFFAQGIANVLTGRDYYRYVYNYKTSSFVAFSDYPRDFAVEFLRCPAK